MRNAALSLATIITNIPIVYRERRHSLSSQLSLPSKSPNPFDLRQQYL